MRTLSSLRSIAQAVAPHTLAPETGTLCGKKFAVPSAFHVPPGRVIAVPMVYVGAAGPVPVTMSSAYVLVPRRWITYSVSQVAE